MADTADTKPPKGGIETVNSKAPMDKKNESKTTSQRKEDTKRHSTDDADKSSKATCERKSTRGPKGGAPALVIEINKDTGRLEKSTTKFNGKALKAALLRPQRGTTTAAEPKSRLQPRGSHGTSLLVQAAMQTSSSGTSGQPLTLPLVTPPTLPQKDPPAPPSPPSLSTERQKRRGVPHTYTDYSNEPDSPSFIRKKTGGVTQPFPEKLHELLTKETGSEDVVGWLPHGRAFIVRKPKAFTSTIMGRYFNQTKLTSFQRQLNLYGFRRITQGPDAGAYYHELFLRGRPQLCMRMQRQKVKGTGHKLPADAETEPNFYNMPSTITEPESPGMQGLRGAANLLQGISAGLPPAALLSKPAHPPGGSYTFTASATNPQHWQYASAVARHAASVERERKAHETSGKGKPSPQAKQDEPPRQEEKENDEKKPPEKDKDPQSQGGNATSGKP